MFRRLLLAAIAVLYVVSIPWYREGAAEPREWFGLPDWVAVALGAYAGAALLNALAWWFGESADPEGFETEP